MVENAKSDFPPHQESTVVEPSTDRRETFSCLLPIPEVSPGSCPHQVPEQTQKTPGNVLNPTGHQCSCKLPPQNIRKIISPVSGGRCLGAQTLGSECLGVNQLSLLPLLDAPPPLHASISPHAEQDKIDERVWQRLCRPVQAWPGGESADMWATILQPRNGGGIKQNMSCGMTLFIQQRRRVCTSTVGLLPPPGAVGKTHHAAGPNQPEPRVAGKMDFVIHQVLASKLSAVWGGIQSRAGHCKDKTKDHGHLTYLSVPRLLMCMCFCDECLFQAVHRAGHFFVFF